MAIVDKLETAIDRLAKGLIPYHKNLDYKVLDCHPKRPSSEQLQAIEQECRDADIIDYQYFRTAEKLREIFPWLKEKKSILFHYNPYSIKEQDWNSYDMVVACNKYIDVELGKITSAPVEYIPLTLDTNFWTYNPDWKADQRAIMSVIMVANRIESKKGILPVAQACKKLGISLQLVGAISDPSYFNEIIETGAVTFHEQITDQQLLELYYKSTVHICNSIDNYESGTMPILEAMLTGVPVITRNVGHVPELNNGENMIINEKAPEDVDNLVELISSLIVDKKKMEEMRDKAWQTAKSRSNKRRAYMIQKLYRQLLYPDKIPVSVVVPIYDKPDIIRKCLDAVSKQTYKNIELIVCDDNLSKENRALVNQFAKFVNFPVKYLRTAQIIMDDEYPDGHKNYGLSRARNIGTIEATGDIMVYCDQRMAMDSTCVEEFVKYAKLRYWLYGNKGVPRPFIENLSCVYRVDIIRFGGFPETITKYGFLSQYCRNIATQQALKTEECKTAKAVPAGKSSNRTRKRQEIIDAKDTLFIMNLE